jgi:hypothetical protein
MAVTGLDVNGALDQHSPFWAQLQATLNFLPAHAWYALPNGALTFLNARIADYLGLPKDHPQRFGSDTGADWDSNLAFLHPDDREETRRVRAALSLRHSRTALGAYYRRIARRLGGDVAVFATARTLATLIYRLLRWGQPYVDEGESLRKPLSPAAHRTFSSHGQRPRLSTDPSKRLRSPHERRHGHDKGLAGRFGVCGALIITPASLLFQWQRKMNEKFREQFEVIAATCFGPTTT